MKQLTTTFILALASVFMLSGCGNLARSAYGPTSDVDTGQQQNEVQVVQFEGITPAATVVR